MTSRKVLLSVLIICALSIVSIVVNANEFRPYDRGFNYHGTYVNYHVDFDTVYNVLDTAYPAQMSVCADMNNPENNYLFFPDQYVRMLDAPNKYYSTPIDYSTPDNFLNSLALNGCRTTASFGDASCKIVLVMTAWGLDASENLLPGYLVYKWEFTPSGVTAYEPVLVKGYPGHYHIAHSQSYS